MSKEYLISVKEVTKIILENFENFGVEKVNFQNTLHRVLKEPIVADRDFPPFNRVSMDGIAIDFDQFPGQKSFTIEGVQAAGSPQLSLQNKKNCIETMTGAILPKGTNAVIPYELIIIKNDVATINTSEIKYFQNIHKQAKDRKKKNLILTKNTLISSADIGVIATVGKHEVTVAKQPKVMIISTGDELVDVNKTPLNYQIRRSNVYTLVSLLENLNIQAATIHIADDKIALKKIIKDLLNNYDVLLFSGAVSKGKFDFIPEILDKLEVKKIFHKVSQRPGKPFWFGKKDKKTIFAFPGNPVSTYVSCLRYFYPWYKKSVGLDYKNNNYAVLDQDYTFKPNLTCFLQVKLTNREGKIYATPLIGHGSGDLANLADVDGFLEIPKGKNLFLKGEVFNYLPFRQTL
ncbi:MAG: molybdopterin molybdotransferase MoeA [Flavobacteriaceae bacterium]|nr:molybdopterin molybdotransferase MoeA [Flavobacteriaceae bacterium]